MRVNDARTATVMVLRMVRQDTAGPRTGRALADLAPGRALAYPRRVIAGFDRDEILHEAVVRPQSARVPFPGSVVVDRPGWFQILTPAFRDGGLNEVSSAVLADDEADAVIDATLAQYAAQGI